jgi:hypothetical protein
VGRRYAVRCWSRSTTTTGPNVAGQHEPTTPASGPIAVMPGSHQRGRASRTPRAPCGRELGSWGACDVGLVSRPGSPDLRRHGPPAITSRALLDNRGHPDTVKDCRSEANGQKLRGYPEGVLEPFRRALAWWSGFPGVRHQAPLCRAVGPNPTGWGRESITPGLAYCSPLTGLTDTVGSLSRIVKALSSHLRSTAA